MGLGNLVSGGTISANIGNLPELEHLELNRAVGGVIPTGIDNLTKLEHLHLDNNDLSGGIPAGIGNLTKLTSLNLLNNVLLCSNFLKFSHISIVTGWPSKKCSEEAISTPDAPPLFVEDTSLSVFWAPDNSYTNDNYDIQYRKFGTTTWTSHTTTDTTTNLDPTTPYQIRINATNKKRQQHLDHHPCHPHTKHHHHHKMLLTHRTTHTMPQYRRHHITTPQQHYTPHTLDLRAQPYVFQNSGTQQLLTTRMACQQRLVPTLNILESSIISSIILLIQQRPARAHLHRPARSSLCGSKYPETQHPVLIPQSTHTIPDRPPQAGPHPTIDTHDPGQTTTGRSSSHNRHTRSRTDHHRPVLIPQSTHTIEWKRSADIVR